MKIGKLSDDELEEYIFKHITKNRSEVIVNSAIGMDTAILDLGSDLCVLSTDPITGASSELGRLAVNISCNDVASEGAEPVGILLSVLVPPSCELEDLRQIIIEANDECEKIGLDIIGGHTEVTDAVNKIVITSTVIGKTNKDSMLNPAKAVEGDVVCISKYIAMEGTVIIAGDRKNELALSDDELAEISEMSEQLSIVTEALLAKKYGVKFMHDITEGGIYGALWETSNCLGKKIVIDKKSIPIKEISTKICEKYALNPYKLISSGSLIMVFSKEDFIKYKAICDELKIKVTEIGRLSLGENVEVLSDEVEVVENTTVDELYKLV